MNLVASPIDERQRAFTGTATESFEGFGMPAEFYSIAALELIPALRIVTEPPAQIGGWRNLLDPLV
jgi:hypothetical protein